MMILTVTLNPSVDISYQLDKLFMDTINRVEDTGKTAGGKGLNVARVLNKLHVEVAATGFLGGSLGQFIQSEINSLGIHDFFVDIAGETRNCIAVIHEGKQTEILESGPVISNEEASLFLEEFIKHVESVDLITISGSLPNGISNDFYGKLIAIANNENIPVLLDVNGELTLSTLEYGALPFFIKPNKEEFGEIIGKEIRQESELMEGLKQEIFKHIPWVVVTLGENGAMIKHHQTMYKATIPEINAVSPVGSGDSVVAGFAAGFTKELKNEELITYALTMGVLNAMEEKTGDINIRGFHSIQKRIDVKRV